MQWVPVANVAPGRNYLAAANRQRHVPVDSSSIKHQCSSGRIIVGMYAFGRHLCQIIGLRARIYVPGPVGNFYERFTIP